MLSCGTECSPSEILQELEVFQSSTTPIKVLTDAGEGFVKATNNRQGTDAVAMELVAAELGTSLGLSIPPFAVIMQSQLSLPLGRTGQIAQAPFFFSQLVEAVPFDGTELYLKKLTNQNDIALLVFFDTWLRNADRFSDSCPNFDNLLIRPLRGNKKFQLVPIDHTHTVAEVDIAIELPDETLTEEEKVYGLFPAFKPYMTAQSVYAAANKLREIAREEIEECVNSIPVAWLSNANMCEHLTDFLIGRAEFVSNWLPNKLLNAPRLPGLE